MVLGSSVYNPYFTLLKEWSAAARGFSENPHIILLPLTGFSPNWNLSLTLPEYDSTDQAPLFQALVFDVTELVPVVTL